MERIGKIIESFASYPVSLVQELIRIFPDGLIMSVGFFSIITLSYPYVIFFLSLLESLLIFHGLRATNTHLNVSTDTPTKDSKDSKCVSGYMSKNLESLSLFGNTNYSAFPSAPLFMFSLASSYVMSTLYRFSSELEVLGPTFASRFYIAGISLPMAIVAFSLYRIYFSCDNFGTILLSIGIGLVVGALLVEQNYRLFGLNSLNLVGVPILRNRTADGNKLYVCSAPPA